MSQNRYITMQGDPVDAGLVTKFTKAADFPAGVAAVGLTYVFEDAMRPPAKPDAPEPNLVLSAGIGVIFDMAIWRMFERMESRRTSLQDKCIDTRPDRNTPPTTAKYGLQAGKLRNYYMGLGVIGGLLDSGLIIYFGLT